MKWLEAYRKREAYKRGYDWAAAEMLNVGTEEQLACLAGHSDFAEGGIDALRTFVKDRTPFEVYDKVWVMCNNAPTEMVIYGVSEEMNHMKTGTQIFYLLTMSQVGATAAGCRKTTTVYATKEALIATL